MEANDLKKILDNSDIEYLENSTHIILKQCPNCGGKDKLFIFKKNLLWQCWKCRGIGEEKDSKGNSYQFLSKVLQLSSLDIRNIFKDSKPIEYVSDDFKTIESVETETQEAQVDIPEYQLPSQWVSLDCSDISIRRHPEAYKYLTKRNVVYRHQYNSFRLKYDPIHKRVIFPAYVDYNKCVGYQSRDITDRWLQFHPKCSNFKCDLFRKYYFKGETYSPVVCPSCGGQLEDTFYPKSINSKGFPKTEFFFNQQNIDWSKPVVLVEGPFDSINTPNSVALLGRILSNTQFHLIRDNNVKELILFLDGDQAGTESIVDTYNKLSTFCTIKIAFLEDGFDPGGNSLETNIKILEETLFPSEWSLKKNIFAIF